MKVEVLETGIKVDPTEDDEEFKTKTHKFQKATTRKEVKPLYSVGAVMPNGTLVKLPLEQQINNQVVAAGELIGLRVYERKGAVILWDFDKNVGVFCPAWSCFAKWDADGAGFCSAACRDATERPTGGRLFGSNATTSANAVRA